MPMLTLMLILGCGGEPEAHVEAPDPTQQPANDNSQAPTTANLACPEGTTLEHGESAKGVEHWCDREGVMHGQYIRFYPDGTKAASGAYDNNSPDGAWIWWHENGQEMTKGKYTKGKQTGSWTWWYENGAREKEGDFLAGRKAGQWTSWFASGLKLEEGLYHNDMKNGTWTYYNDDDENSVLKTELWQNGQMTEEKVFNDKNRKKKK